MRLQKTPNNPPHKNTNVNKNISNTNTLVNTEDKPQEYSSFNLYQCFQYRKTANENRGNKGKSKDKSTSTSFSRLFRDPQNCASCSIGSYIRIQGLLCNLYRKRAFCSHTEMVGNCSFLGKRRYFISK